MIKPITKKDEKSIFSLNGTDGVIERIFNEIGYTNKIAVEIGVSEMGEFTNTTFLSSLGFKFLWLDCISRSDLSVKDFQLLP